MAAIRFVWGYRAGILIILGLFAGHALANGASDAAIMALDAIVEALRA